MSWTLSRSARTSARPACLWRAAGALLAGAATLAAMPAAHAWEPAKPVEFIVPAGTGGGADQMARFIQGVVAKNKLMNQPIVVVNRSGGAGAEGFLDVKGDKGNPRKIIITLTTNGWLLERKAQALADAGLKRVTVSLDALDDGARHVEMHYIGG